MEAAQPRATMYLISPKCPPSPPFSHRLPATHLFRTFCSRVRHLSPVCTSLMLRVRSCAIMTFVLAAGRSNSLSLVLNSFPASIVRNIPHRALRLVSRSVPPPIRSTSQRQLLLQGWATTASHGSQHDSTQSYCTHQCVLRTAGENSSFQLPLVISRSVGHGSQLTVLAAARSSAGHNNAENINTGRSSSSSSNSTSAVGNGDVRRVVRDTAKVPLTGPQRTGVVGRITLGASNAWDGRAAGNGVGQPTIRHGPGVAHARGKEKERVTSATTYDFLKYIVSNTY